MDFGERLEQEGKRIGLKKPPAMAAAGGVSVASYHLYTSSKRAPDLRKLKNWHEAGIDIFYVITGQRLTSTATLSNDEQDLLRLYHAAPLAVKATLLAMLSAGSGMGSVTQTVSGSVGQQAGGNITNDKPNAFTFADNGKKKPRS